jgi:DNA-binding transcriptional LysR family regulator
VPPGETHVRARHPGSVGVQRAAPSAEDAHLQRQRRAFEIVCTSSSLSGIEAALRAHFGITVPARRLLPAGLEALGGEAGLPDLGSMVTGLYVRPGASAAEAQLLASYFAELFQVDAAAPAAA